MTQRNPYFTCRDDPERCRCTGKIRVEKYGRIQIRPCKLWAQPGTDRCWRHQRNEQK